MHNNCIVCRLPLSCYYFQVCICFAFMHVSISHSIQLTNSNQFSRNFVLLSFSSTEEFIAVPILSILETLDFHNFEPAIACLFVLVCSCAFIEIFSEMFNLIVTLTTSDWKILSRQIGYEHGDSGSPVLAVFTGGSICAMIAFACPLEIIIYFIAGSQLTSGVFRAMYLFYSPFRPKYIINTKSKIIHEIIIYSFNVGHFSLFLCLTLICICKFVFIYLETK